MMIAVAEREIDGPQALEVVTDGQLARHPHGSMKLDGLLPHAAAGLPHQDLRRRDGPRAKDGVGMETTHARQKAHRARLLDLPQHVRQAVLDRLEGADLYAKLLARLDVLDGRLEDGVERAHRLGAQRRDADL